MLKVKIAIETPPATTSVLQDVINLERDVSDGCELYLNRDHLLGMIISTLEQMCTKERRYRIESQPESVALWRACFAFFLEVSKLIRSESHPQTNSVDWL